MSIGRFWFNHSNHVNAPHGERPRRGENVELSWWHMDLICVDLALVTSFDVFAAIGFHRYPIVSCSQDFSRHCMLVLEQSRNLIWDLFFNFFLGDFTGNFKVEKERRVIAFNGFVPLLICMF